MSSKSDILRQIASIKRRGATMDKDIHSCAVACLIHARDHGDVTLLSKLVAAMPRSGRREALIFWARYYGILRFEKKSEAFKIDKKRKEAGEGFDVEGATKTPFYDLTPEKNPAPFDLDRTISSFAKRLKKAKAEGKLGDVSPATVADRVRQTLNTALADAS